jgi:bacterioferritin-associated ferredoxin
MIICICKKISDRDIAYCAQSGMSFDDAQLELGVSTQCGKCEDCARDVFSQCSRGATVAFIKDAGKPVVT